MLCLFLLRCFDQQQRFEAIKKIPEQEQVLVTGSIYKKECKKEDVLYYLKKVSITGENQTLTTTDVIVRVPSDDFRIGNVVEFDSKMRWMNVASNTGSFDERAYYHSLGIVTFLYSDGLQLVAEGRNCPVGNGLFWLRVQLRQVFSIFLNEKDAGILSSMILGDKSLMEDELKQLYSSAGISHILAVSGLHVSIIGMSLFRFLRKRGQSYGVCCAVSGIVLLLFCIMSGMSVSALRAGIMFLIFLGAQFLGRKYHSPRGLLFAAIVSLYLNPGYLSNAGFWFSYMAVFGAVCIGQYFQNQGKCWYHKLINTLTLSSSIMVTTLPLTAYYFYEIPLYGILANLVVIPLAGMVMGFGLLGGFLNLLGIPGMWIVFLPCHGILRLYEGICKGIAYLPWDVWITGKPPDWAMILYYGLLVVWILVIRQKKEWVRLVLDWVLKSCERFYGKCYGKCYERFKYLIFIGLPVVAMCIMFTQPPAKQFQVSFLDVGQGDGIYINGGDGHFYFVDGGSTSQKELGRYCILPFLKYHGVREIDVWFVSHADMDHISGLLTVLEKGYPLETILVSDQAPQDENLKQLVDLATKQGTRVLAATNESYIQGEGYRITCYTPEASVAGDRNEASLVLHLAYNQEGILLTGDIGSDQESWLLEQSGINQVDVLKAAHHGSKYSNSQEFLQTLDPKLIIISAGANNLYGHPHSETLKRIEAVGGECLLTMDVGEIRLVSHDRDGLFLSTYK